MLHRIGSLCLLTLVAAAGAVAQDQTGSISGRVLNALTGEPLSKAQVSIRSLGRSGMASQATTDELGQFFLTGLASGRFQLSASHAGFLHAVYADNDSGAAPTLSAGEQRTNIEIRLTPLASFSGTVLDKNNEPVGRAMVTLLQARWSATGRVVQSSNTVVTAADGTYQFPTVQPGTYFVCAELPFRRRQAEKTAEGQLAANAADDAQEGYRRTCFGGTTDIFASTPLSSAAGASRQGIDIVLQPGKLASVSGRVVGLQTEGQKGYQVSLREVGNTRFNLPASSGEDGRFIIPDVAPGSYLLVVSQSGQRGRTVGGVPVDVPEEGLTNLEVDAGRTAQLSVAGSMDDDGATVGAAQLKVGLLALEIPGCEREQERVGTKPASFADLCADRYQLTVFHSNKVYVKSVLWGTQALPDGILDLRGGGSATVEVLLSTEIATLEGSVVDSRSQAVAGAAVLLVPTDARSANSSFFLRATSGSDGRFRLTGAPGSYQVFAWTNIESGADNSADIRALHLNEAKSVTLEGGLLKNIELEAIDMAGQQGGKN